MHATTGDRIIIRHPQLGGSPRGGEIMETRGPDGTPPYVVRWDEDGHEALVFPGPDAEVQHLGVDAHRPHATARRETAAEQR